MKQLTVQDFGTLKNGEKAHLYIMENDRGTSAAVTDYGAALVNLRTPDKNGTLLDVVLGFDDVSGYERNRVFRSFRGKKREPYRGSQHRDQRNHL